MEAESNYLKYRGKCKEYCEKAIECDPTLTLTRGYYFDAVWGKDEPHWWTVREDGTIFDPTKKQFPTCGGGIYTEFDGWFECEQCGKKVSENDAITMGNYVCCSGMCAKRLVGVY